MNFKYLINIFNNFLSIFLINIDKIHIVHK